MKIEADSGFMRFLTLNDRGFLTLMGITGNRTEGSRASLIRAKNIA
jgi:hypothetical protein